MSRTRSHVRQDRTRKALRWLAWLTLLACTGCLPEPAPDYCYRVGDPTNPTYEAWYCEGRAQFPADTLPDDLKGKREPVGLAPLPWTERLCAADGSACWTEAHPAVECVTDSECEGLDPVVLRDEDTNR